jgi:hypothetical protein
MKKIFYGLLFAIIVSLPGRLAALPQDESEFVPAENAIWTEDTDEDGVISKFTKGDECYIIIRRPDGTNQDGIAIRTTEKPTISQDGSVKKPVIQWNFFVLNTMGKKKYSFSFWGENQEEATGPEISANCTKYLPELLPETQKELRKYGAMK